RRLYPKIVPVDAKVSNRPQIVPVQRNYGWNRDAFCHSVQREIAIDLHFVTICRRHPSRYIRTLESNVRILIRMKHDLFQFLVDDLFLLFRKVSAGLVERGGFHDKSQRCGRNGVRSKLDPSTEVTRLQVMAVTLKP